MDPPARSAPKTRQLPDPARPMTPRVAVRVAPRKTVPPKQRATNYLIVAASSLAASAKRWVAYRQRTGHRVELLLTGDVKGAPLRQGIRNHIAALYGARDSKRPFYVLLLGDAPRLLPAWTSRQSTAPITTDNPYADMDDDGIPDLALGRIPAMTDAEVDGIRAKVQRYESSYKVGPWNRRIHLFAAPGDYGGFVDALIEGVAADVLEQLSYDYDLQVLYGARGSPAAYPPHRFSDRVYELLNSGSLFTVYLGHGTEKGPQYGWWNGKSYDIWKTQQLERKLRMRNKTPVLLLVACDMGRFAGVDGLGEKLLRHPQGPPAVIAATATSHPYPNTLLVRELGLLATHERVATTGLLLQRAKSRMMRQRDPGRDVLEGLAALVSTDKFREHLRQTHLRMYVLLGDPALRIRYVPHRAQLLVETPTPRPGGQLTVTAHIPTPSAGLARFTLETRRSVILGTLQPLPPDGDPRRDRVLLDNHRKANDKVVATHLVRYRTGRSRVTLRLPSSLPPGKYLVKVYAQDGRADALGNTPVQLATVTSTHP